MPGGVGMVGLMPSNGARNKIGLCSVVLGEGHPFWQHKFRELMAKNKFAFKSWSVPMQLWIQIREKVYILNNLSLNPRKTVCVPNQCNVAIWEHIVKRLTEDCKGNASDVRLQKYIHHHLLDQRQHGNEPLHGGESRSTRWRSWSSICRMSSTEFPQETPSIHDHCQLK